MKVFENKSIFKKIVIMLLIILVASFCFSGKVQAADGEAKGGKLLNPIIDLLVFLGDGCINIVHSVIYGYSESTIGVNLGSTVLDIIKTIGIGILAAVIIAAAVVFTAGAVAAAAAAIGVTLASIGTGTVIMVSVVGGVAAAAVFNSNALPGTIELPVYQISPEAIFSNEIGLFDVNFFREGESQVARDSDGNILYDENGNIIYWESTAQQLKETIANWYNVLRDIAVVALLSILVYVGIRIVISSTSNDKAKYKQLLMDWIIAMCLLFVMQYIMSFSNLIIEKVVDLIGSLKYNKGYFSLIADEDGKIEERLSEMGYDISSIKTVEGGVTYINWKTNILGYARLNAQMHKETSATYAGYGLIFLVLVLFTIYFIFTYLRRVLYMAFLTIIAPLVAMTYPIDKITDGKAQAFNMWFKEYIFNLLIQPMHLILYTVLVTSAFELAATNIIYSLVAIGFMIPAEKLLRKFFGFEKAQTPGLLSGAAGAAMTMTAMNKLLSKGQKGGGKLGDSKSSSKDNEDSQKPPRINKDFNKQDAILGLDKGEEEEEDTEQRPRDNRKNRDLDIQQEENGDKNDEESNDIPKLDEKSNSKEIDSDSEDSEDEKDIKQKSAKDYEDNSDQDIGNGVTGAFTQDELDELLQKEMEAMDSSNESNKKKKKISNTKKGSKKNKSGRPSVGRYYFKGLKNKAARRIMRANPVEAGVRKLAKVTGGVAAGTLAGGIGLAAGIASGDMSKTWQYGGGAALGGYKLGTVGVSGVDQALKVDGIQEIQERAKYKNEQEYKDAQQQKYVERYQKDIKNQFKLEQKYGKKEAKRIMKDVVPECLDKGVTNMEDIITINELVNSGAVDSLDMGIATAKYASMMGDVTKMKAKDKNEWHKTLKEGFDKNKKLKANNMDADQEATKSMDRIRMFYNIKSEL